MTKYVAGMYNIYVEDFMVREVRYIWHGITFGQLKDILKDNRNLRSFPLVDSPGIYTVKRIQGFVTVTSHFENLLQYETLKIQRFKYSDRQKCVFEIVLLNDFKIKFEII